MDADLWDELELDLYMQQQSEDAGCASHAVTGYLHHVRTHHTVDQDQDIPF